MTFADYAIDSCIYIDFGEEIVYGSDQVDISYPVRFATVSFQLFDTNLLSRIADQIRAEKGYTPMHPLPDWEEENCDQNGWYNFYIGLNNFSATKLDSTIQFTVVNSDSDDNEQQYDIDLSEPEQVAILKALDRQCLKYLNKDCIDLLAESQAEMEKEYKEEAVPSAENIIRCKDCALFNEQGCPFVGYLTWPKKNDFCSFGRRK